MLSNYDKERLMMRYIKHCQEMGIASDLYDINAKIDSNIDYWENWNLIEEDLNKINGTLQQQQIKNVKMELAKPESIKFEIDLDMTDSVAVLGDRNSGKTNLSFYLMNKYKGKKQKYLFGYPKDIDGYKHLSDWGDIYKVTDSIIFIDEIQRYIKIYDKRANSQLLEFISFLAHQNNTLIFTTQLSQFITKGVEASIQTWCIKELDVGSLKNGCKVKRILRNTKDPRITDEAMAININEFVAYDKTMPIGFNGIHTFDDQSIGKDWRNADSKSDNKCDKNKKVK